MNRILRIGGLAALLGMAGTRSWAAEKGQLSVELEYWNEDDAYDRDEQDVDDISGFVDSASFDVKPGMGGRVAYYFPSAKENMDVGLSLGYIQGPKADINIDDALGVLKAESETNFVRALVEGRLGIPLSGQAQIRLRGGIGVAHGKIEGKMAGTGVFAGSGSVDDTWTGFTWELGPSIVFSGERLGFELGVVYAGFPKFKETDDFNEFEWTPFGVRAGISF